MTEDSELDKLVKEMNYRGGLRFNVESTCGSCTEPCGNDWCVTKEKTVKEKLAECIESYLTETDTSDIFDYHGRMLSEILISEGFVKE